MTMIKHVLIYHNQWLQYIAMEKTWQFCHVHVSPTLSLNVTSHFHVGSEFNARRVQDWNNILIVFRTLCIRRCSCTWQRIHTLFISRGSPIRDGSLVEYNKQLDPFRHHYLLVLDGEYLPSSKSFPQSYWINIHYGRGLEATKMQIMQKQDQQKRQGCSTPSWPAHARP